MTPSRNEEPEDPSPAETRQLVERFRSGEVDRFRELYERIAPSLVAWARVRSNPGFALDPDDLLQEVWVRALEGLGGFDPARGSFRAWIFGIAKYVALESWKRGTNIPAVSQMGSQSGSNALDSWPDVATSIRSRLASEESGRLLMEHVATLDPEDRMLVVQCGMEGMECAVVAVRLGLSRDAANKRWQRLRARLAERPFASLLEV